MKTLSQAGSKTAKPTSIARVQKRQDHAPLPIPPLQAKPLAILAGDPLASRECFEVELDWIGDTMEPEVFQGNLAMVSNRKEPCLTELALGLLKNGKLVFGAYNMSDDDRSLRIDFINPKYPSVYYREDDFLWLYPVATVSSFDETGRFRRIMKHIEFERGNDRDASVVDAAPSRR